MTCNCYPAPVCAGAGRFSGGPAHFLVRGSAFSMLGAARDCDDPSRDHRADPDPVSCESRCCPEQPAADGDHAANWRFRHQSQSEAARDADARASPATECNSGTDSDPVPAIATRYDRVTGTAADCAANAADVRAADPAAKPDPVRAVGLHASCDAATRRDRPGRTRRCRPDTRAARRVASNGEHPRRMAVACAGRRCRVGRGAGGGAGDCGPASPSP